MNKLRKSRSIVKRWVFAGSHLEAICFVDAKRKELLCKPLGFSQNTAIAGEWDLSTGKWDLKKISAGKWDLNPPSGPSKIRGEKMGE